MDVKKDVQKQFGKSAESYVTSTIHKDGKDLGKLLEIASILGEESLLDIATGGGHTANAFAPYVKKVTAVDLTPEIIAAAEKFIKGNGHQNVEFVHGDAEDLPFPNEENKFRLIFEEDQIFSFQGEAVVLKAMKR